MNILYAVIFYALGAVIVGATGLAVTRRNPIHAVIFLVVSFFGTALLFYLLGAPLLAALEVIIYAGAIMVFFLFIVMTLNMEELEPLKHGLRQWIVPLALGAAGLGLGSLFLLADPHSGLPLKSAMASPLAFGQFLFEHYWYPVEIVSFLLFVGLVGVLYLGRERGEAARADQKDSL